MAGEINSNQYSNFIQIKGREGKVDLNKLTSLKRTEQNKTIFDMVDHNKDGKIDSNEALSLRGVLLTASNGDGTLTKKEANKLFGKEMNAYDAIDALAKQQAAFEANQVYTETVNGVSTNYNKDVEIPDGLKFEIQQMNKDLEGTGITAKFVDNGDGTFDQNDVKLFDEGGNIIDNETAQSLIEANYTFGEVKPKEGAEDAEIEMMMSFDKDGNKSLNQSEYQAFWTQFLKDAGIEMTDEIRGLVDDSFKTLDSALEQNSEIDKSELKEQAKQVVNQLVADIETLENQKYGIESGDEFGNDQQNYDFSLPEPITLPNGQQACKIDGKYYQVDEFGIPDLDMPITINMGMNE